MPKMPAINLSSSLKKVHISSSCTFFAFLFPLKNAFCQSPAINHKTSCSHKYRKHLFREIKILH